MGRVHKKKIAEYAETSEGKMKSNSNSTVSKSSFRNNENDDSNISSEDQYLFKRDENKTDNDDTLNGDDKPLNDSGLQKKSQSQKTSTTKTKIGESNNSNKQHNVKRGSASAKRKIVEKSKNADKNGDEFYSDEDEPLIGASMKKKISKASTSAKEKKRKSSEDSDMDYNPGESDENEEFEVQDIVDSKIENGIVYYLIRWKGYNKDDDTWEAEDTLSCPKLIQKFKKKQSKPQKGISSQKKVSASHSKESTKTEEDPNKEWEVEKIIDYAETKSGRQFRIRWKGFKSKHDTWEPESNLSCDDIIEKFMERMKSQEFISFKVLREDPKKTKRLVNETAPITNYHNAIGRKSKRNMLKRRIFYGDSDE